LSQRVLAPSESAEVLQEVQHSLFRLELQPEYNVGDGVAKAARFVAGDRDDPGADPGMRRWCSKVRTWRDRGIRIERVRVVEDPPTDYQRWERWVGAWNIDAGEVLRYMTRHEAFSCELLPAAGTTDWWLIDSQRVLQTRYTPDHRIDQQILDDTPEVVVQACAWRDLAVHCSHLESFQGIAMQGLPS
jgi:hypothetical protein